MLITSIENINKYKVIVTIDNDEKIYLKIKDLEMFDLEVGEELTLEQFNIIKDNYLFPRAKEKALDFITQSSKSCYEIREKLKKAHYTEDIIDKIITFLKEYNLVNDKQYAIDYYNYTKCKKSLNQIKFDLKRKGIENNYLDEYLKNECIDPFNDEILQIERIINKYKDDNGDIPNEKKNKIAASLYRKGYNSSLIYKKLSIYE